MCHPRNICNNINVRGQRYYYQGHMFNCPVQGFVSFVTRCIVKSTETYCCIAVLSGTHDCCSRVSLSQSCFSFATLWPTHYSHVFLAPSKHFFFLPLTLHSTRHRCLFSLFYVQIFPAYSRPLYHTPHLRYNLTVQ